MALRNVTSEPIAAEYVDSDGNEGCIELGPDAVWAGDVDSEIGAVIAAQLEAAGAVHEDEDD
jgi:hypothetical protein